ncbi:polyketide cyclase, partial [archaeon]|nr:polyketide cyclase [archaeon]
LAVVEEHFNLGTTEMLVMARHVSTKPVLHEIFIIGGDAKGSHIRQEFIELENGTKILMDVDFKLRGKMKLSYMFGKNTLLQNYAVIMNDFGKVAES